MSLLRQLFGPSKEEIWRQFCAETGGIYTAGGFLSGGQAVATHGQWTVTLDTFVVSTGKSCITYTRVQAPYINPDRFTFTIYRKGIFSDMGKWMGMQDVTVGYPDFDEAFIIQGNDEQKLRKLFANQKIRDLISAQPNINFSVLHNSPNSWGGRGFPPGVDELYFRVPGLIKDVDRLKLLYELFSETLDELCRMGSAYQESPGVKL